MRSGSLDWAHLCVFREFSVQTLDTCDPELKRAVGYMGIDICVECVKYVKRPEIEGNETRHVCLCKLEWYLCVSGWLVCLVFRPRRLDYYAGLS